MRSWQAGRHDLFSSLTSTILMIRTYRRVCTVFLSTKVSDTKVVASSRRNKDYCTDYCAVIIAL